MNFEFFVAKRITYQSSRSFSRVIIRIALTAIALSLAIMLISDAIVIGFQSEIKNKITAFASHIQVSKSNTNLSFENEPVKYDKAFVENIRSMKGVTHVQSFATKPGIIKTEDVIEGVVLKGAGRDYDWNSLKGRLVEGAPIEFNDTMPSEQVILSREIAKKLNLKLHDELVMYFVQQPPRARKLKVQGIYETSIEEIDKVFVITDIQQIQRLNNWKDEQIGGYEIYLDGFERMEEVNEEIRYMAGIDEDTKTIRERYPQIFDWLGLLNVNVDIILSLMGMVAAINMVTALLIMILERTQMIGVFKALGATDWRLQKVFILNAMVLIVLGLIIGNVTALGLLALQKYFHIIKLSQESYYLPSVPVFFSWYRILMINLGAFIFCSLSTFLPSLLVLRVRPSKALRFE